MNKGLYFLLGAAIGSGVTWYVLKTKYERLAQEEIDSVKEVFSNRKKSLDEKKADPIKETYLNPRRAEAFDKPNIMEYAAKLAEERYTNYDAKKKEELDKKDSIHDIYAIPPEEFGELGDYDTIPLTYYSDDILADDEDELLDDIEGAVGLDFDSHFGEYEDDSVYIRNDIRKIDYEILRSEYTYEEAKSMRPGRVEVQ